MIRVQEGNIYSFKLISSEELVGKVIKVEDDYYVVETPLASGMTQKGLQLMPTMFTVELDANINISKNAIAMTGVPREDITDAYRTATTGIAVPDKQIILG